MQPITHWLSFGAGVNSMALLVLLCEGKIAGVERFRVLFCDTMDERDETYDYLFGVAMPYARKHGSCIEVCRDSVGVLERWERSGFVGSRQSASCSDNAKTQPFRRHLKSHGKPEDVTIIGIHSSEDHRAKEYPNIVYPLVQMGIDQDGCEKIIRDAGLNVPLKSGCWHCPHARVREVLTLAKDHPEKFRRIIRLEMAAEKRSGKEWHQWGDRSAKEWAARACDEKSSGPLFQEVEPDAPCLCQFN